MPILYKFFLLFLLKHGAGVIAPNSSTDQPALYSSNAIIQVPKVLQLQIDGPFDRSQALIDLCYSQDTACEICSDYDGSAEVPGNTRTLLTFSNLAPAKQQVLVNRVQRYAAQAGGDLRVSWR